MSLYGLTYTASAWSGGRAGMYNALAEVASVDAGIIFDGQLIVRARRTEEYDSVEPDAGEPL